MSIWHSAWDPSRFLLRLDGEEKQVPNCPQRESERQGETPYQTIEMSEKSKCKGSSIRGAMNNEKKKVQVRNRYRSEGSERNK